MIQSFQAFGQSWRIDHIGCFFYWSALKTDLSVRLHENPFKKVLSVRISKGSGTWSFLGRTSKKNTLYILVRAVQQTYAFVFH